MASKAELATLNRKRGTLKRRVTEFLKYVVDRSNNDTSSDEDAIELETRLARVTNIINDYENIQEKIDELIASDATLKDEENYREEFESVYYSAITKAKIFIKNVSVQAASSSPAPNANPICGNSIKISGVKLPAIELPKFNGNFENWLEFRDAFDAMVHQSQVINNVQKFYYLKAFLEGDAAKLVACIQTTASNYPIAWARLCERYESKKLLVQSHMHSLFNMSKIHKESASQLREMLDKTMLCMSSLSSVGISIDSWDPVLIFILSSKFDITTAREWENFKTLDELPTFSEMCKFISDRANTLEILNFNKVNLGSTKGDKDDKAIQNKYYNIKFKNRTLTAMKISCYLCKGEHTIYNCEEFLQLTVAERIGKVKLLKLCFNCLRQGHGALDCKARGCMRCKLKHNSLLHKERERVEASAPTGEEVCSHSRETVLASVGRSKSAHTLLSTAQVIICGTQGNMVGRVMLDSGSQSNFISEATAKRLNLIVKPIEIKITGLNNCLTNIKGRCDVKFTCRSNVYVRTIQCLVVPEITDNLPQFRFEIQGWNIPRDLFLADASFNMPGEIHLLLGADIFWDLLIMERLNLGVGKPTLQRTKLGWVVAGPIEDMSAGHSRCHFSKNGAIEEQLAKFWELEELCDKRVLSEDERACESHFQANFKRNSDGRFIVSIPFKHSMSLLGDSKERTLKRFKKLETKLQVKPQLRDQYNAFMREYAELNHMSKEDGNRERNGTEYYLPHHGVLNEASATTKLRVVFDGSFPSDSGYSINDIQHVGPEIQSDLVSILLRFRQHAIALSADISKMYRQILINKEDRVLQKIFWRDDPSKHLATFELNTLTYGTRSASFLAKRCLRQLAIENSNNKVSNLIIEDFYMDDFLSGCDNDDEAIIVCNQVSEILMQGCFPLRKWLSNKPEILQGFADLEDDLKLMPIGETGSTKTLGLFWNSIQDSLGFCVSAHRNEYKAITKRSILSTISQIFDPLGLIGACTIKAKILLQLIWKEKIDWDDSIPNCILTQWIDLHSQLQVLNNLKLPRRVLISNHIKIELHGFADASERAYGACIYIKSIDSVGHTNIQLLCSKSKVAPLKFTTIPRLELCAALILAKLQKKVTDSLRVEFDMIRLWSDSQITIAWIRSNIEGLKVFVANRVSQINELSNQTQWCYVPTDSNPADMLSRGISPIELINSQLWWEGPQWLATNAWPQQPVYRIKELPELKSLQRTFIAAAETPLIDISRFSNYNRLIRAIAYIFRFNFNSAHTTDERRKGSLCQFEIDKALSYLVTVVQAEMFQEELRDLRGKGNVSKKSSMASLAPFLDKESVIRVGGRLQAAELPYSQRHPIIITARHRFTELLFRCEHIRLGHAGSQQLLCSIRDRFWPIRGKLTAKRIVRECVRCFRVQPRNNIPQMGNLPGSRINPTFPFQISGVDYAGPFTIITKRGRGARKVKCYFALFVCFTSKAVHIEVVSDLTTDAFIAALKRFIARRGKPKEIHSDNATNFVGTNNELHRVRLDLESNERIIKDALACEGVAWHFIPPRAPHFGGLWEAGVRLAKLHLKRILGTFACTYEELGTLTCQVEAILNSRPLTSLSDNPEDLEPLTPSHFLIGRKLTSLPEHDLTGIPLGRLSNYQAIQQLGRQFWNRWRTEYLHELQPRRRWRSSTSKQLQEGDLVLIKEDNVPPLSWPIGRVVKVYPGTDNIVRVADIHTTSGIFKRATVKLFPLPSSEDKSTPTEQEGHTPPLQNSD